MNAQALPAEVATAGPVAPSERIEVVDVLRGFAMFGILAVNMEGFSSAGYRDAAGERLWTGLADRLAELLISYWATGKFIILFSFLFGLSFAILMQRSSARGVAFLPLQTRRLLALLAIGFVHAFLIWYGDILIVYALAGALLVLFRRARPRTLIVWAIALNLLSFVHLEVGIVRSITASPAAGRAPTIAPPRADGASVADRATPGSPVYGQRDVAAIMRQRVHDAWAGLQSAPADVPRRLSVFLVGLFVFRIGLLERVHEERVMLRRLVVWGLVVGLLAHAGRFILSLQQMPDWTRALRLPASIVGNPAMALVYAGGVVLLFGTAAGRRWLSPLAPVGRTALSNYLLQSVICTLIFYGYGLGLYGRVGPAVGLALSAGIFGVEMLLSGLWVRRYQYGPAEWLWRSVTYWRRQPLLIGATRA